MDNAQIHKARCVTESFREMVVGFQYLPLYKDINISRLLPDCQGEVLERRDSNEPGGDACTTGQRLSVLQLRPAPVLSPHVDVCPEGFEP